MDVIQEKVVSAVRNVARLPYEQIRLDTRMEQLAVDSIDQASLAFELEDALSVEIPDGEVWTDVVTLGDLIEKMRRLCAEATAEKATT